MFSIAAYLVSSKIGVQKCHIIETYAPENRLYIVYRGSYISAHVLLNLLNELGKRDKMRGLPRSIFVFSGRYHIISNASLVNNCFII